MKVRCGVNPWDVAAGIVLVEEAGGRATDLSGKPVDLRSKNIEIVVSNPGIHDALIRVVHYASRRGTS